MEGLIISVQEARKILGSDAKNMSDKQIEEAIISLHIIAKDSLQRAAKELRPNKDSDMA